MAKFADLPQPERLRKTAFVGAPAIAVGTAIGALLSGHWTKLIGAFIFAVILVAVGIFAPQIISSWEHRNDPRQRR
jgi:hypothetical protein